MSRGSVKGIGRVRRIMKGLPESTRAEIAAALERVGPIVQALARARAPIRRGAVRAGITFKVFPKTLRLQVGLLGTKKGRAKLFYGRIQDGGRTAQTVTVQRRRRVGVTLSTGQQLSLLRTNRSGRKETADIVSTYQMRVRGMAPKRFVSGRLADARKQVVMQIQGIWDRAIAKLAGGSDA